MGTTYQVYCLTLLLMEVIYCTRSVLGRKIRRLACVLAYTYCFTLHLVDYLVIGNLGSYTQNFTSKHPHAYSPHWSTYNSYGTSWENLLRHQTFHLWWSIQVSNHLPHNASSYSGCDGIHLVDVISEYRRCQAIYGIVGSFNQIIHVLELHDLHHRPKDLAKVTTSIKTSVSNNCLLGYHKRSIQL